MRTQHVAGAVSKAAALVVSRCPSTGAPTMLLPWSTGRSSRKAVERDGRNLQIAEDAPYPIEHGGGGGVVALAQAAAQGRRIPSALTEEGMGGLADGGEDFGLSTPRLPAPLCKSPRDGWGRPQHGSRTAGS